MHIHLNNDLFYVYSLEKGVSNQKFKWIWIILKRKNSFILRNHPYFHMLWILYTEELHSNHRSLADTRFKLNEFLLKILVFLENFIYVHNVSWSYGPLTSHYTLQHPGSLSAHHPLNFVFSFFNWCFYNPMNTTNALPECCIGPSTDI